jgi:hypothetical protein
MLLSEFLDTLKKKISQLAEKYFWLLFCIVLLIVVLINGVSLVPPEHYYRLAQNPFVTRTDISLDNYWQESILLPLFTYYTHLNSKAAFHLFCVVIIILSFSLFALLSKRRYGKSLSLLFTTLLILSSLTTVLLSWVGMPDNITVLLTVPLFFTNSLLWFFVLSILGMTNHVVFAFVVMEILTLRWVAREKALNHWHFLVTILGLSVGYFVVNAFLAFNGINILNRIDFMSRYGLDSWAAWNTNYFPMTLFSLLNSQWLILAVCFIMFFNKDRRFFAAVFFFLVVNYLITFFTLDTTRVFALLSWGIVFESIFHSYHLARKESNDKYEKELSSALLLVAFLSIIVPRYYAFEGEIVLSPFKEFLTRITSYFFGH